MGPAVKVSDVALKGGDVLGAFNGSVNLDVVTKKGVVAGDALQYILDHGTEI